MMKLKLVAFGIARDILRGTELEIEIAEGSSVSDLKVSLVNSYPSFADLTSLRFAVEEEYKSDDYTLSDGDEVVIIPPVSGG